MLVSYNWLSKYVDLKGISAKEVGELLTKHGIEVETIQTTNSDQMLELSLTPNRSDCLNMLGVAYEMAAILGKIVAHPKIETTFENRSTKDLKIAVEETGLSEFYGLALVSELEVNESQQMLKDGLESVGIRPINNVVDITNYVMLEYGQPLHAYDADKVSGKVSVRFARDGETVITLDDKKQVLTCDDIVIADEEKIIGIAGVMGAKNSEVDENTKRILLEFALFDPSNIRKTSKRLDLRSEASLRFEKGLDRNRVKKSALRAIDLLLSSAGGNLIEVNFIDECKEKRENISIALDKINKTLGFEVNLNSAKTIFKKLGFEFIENDGIFTITPPSRRRDIEIEADIIEEVARMYGYDNIPNTLPEVNTKETGLTAYQKNRRKMKRLLSSLGLHQTITYSLTKRENAKDGLSLLYPISEERSALRSSLIPHLLEVVSYNKNRKEENNFLYEIGNVFKGREQREMLAAAFSGNWVLNSWKNEIKKVDFFVVKGILDRIWSELGVLEQISYQKIKLENMHPGRTAEIQFNEKRIGYIAQIHPSLQEETYVFEIELEELLNKEKQDRFETISKYPIVSRDLSLVVEKNIAAGEITKVVKNLGLSLLKDSQIIDLYEGEKMEPGKKSLTLSLKYENKEKTLTDDEILTCQEQVISELEKELSATIRK
jgi:phenylalanyl-tRNA synthetase beta chain